jgi:hypothetical protein
MNNIPKARYCKACKARFKPASVYEWCCCPEHETAYKSSQMDKQRQQQSASRLRSLKKLKQVSRDKKPKTTAVIKIIRACKPNAADYAQVAINRYVCLRDYGKPCISCGQPMTDSGFSKLECGHYRSRGAAKHLRFHLHNMNGQCHHCNQVLSGNREGFKLGLTSRIGQQKVEALNNDNRTRMFTTEYYQRIKSIFTRKARRLEKRRANQLEVAA